MQSAQKMKDQELVNVYHRTWSCGDPWRSCWTGRGVGSDGGVCVLGELELTLITEMVPQKTPQRKTEAILTVAVSYDGRSSQETK